MPALRHPVAPIVAVLVAIGLVSAVVNSVPLHVAALGIIVTVDAVVLFFLARMADFGERRAALFAAIFVSAMFGAAVVAILQTLLGPQAIGLPFRVGIYGESLRAGSFFVDPGVLGAAAGVAAGFALFAAFRLERPRARYTAIAVAFVLLVAVVLTFSRGSWLGLVAGTGLVALILDRRVLALTALLGVLSVGTVAVMPRNLLPIAPEQRQAAATASATDDAGTTAVPTPSRAEAPTATAPPAPDIVGSTVAKTLRVFTGSDARARFIINAVPIVTEHPLLGVGPGRYGGAVAAIFGTPIHAAYETNRILERVGARTVDNFWLHVLVELGLAGLLAYLTLIAVAGVMLFRAARRSTGRAFVVIAGTLAMLAFFAVHSVTGMLLEGNALSFALWLFVGICSTLAPATDSR